jgi:hypothetical protein
MFQCTPSHIYICRAYILNTNAFSYFLHTHTCFLNFFFFCLVILNIPIHVWMDIQRQDLDDDIVQVTTEDGTVDRKDKTTNKFFSLSRMLPPVI